MMPVLNSVSLILILRSIRPSGIKNEYRFHPVRKWRFDFAYPDIKVAFEYEGVFQTRKNRHTNPVGYTKDCEKYNEAQRLGWQVYRFTAKMLQEGKTVDLIRDVLTQR